MRPFVKLVSSEVATAVSTVVTEKLGQYLEQHPKEARNIINKAVVAARAREAALQLSDLHFGPNSRFAGVDMPRRRAPAQPAVAAAGGAIGRMPAPTAALPLVMPDGIMPPCI